MKKALIIGLFALFVCGGTAFAQQSTFAKSKKVTDSEVPVAVVKAFQQDHADVQDKGFWKLHYTETITNGKSTFVPEYYTFNGKKDGEKVVYTYSTAGVQEANKTGSNSRK